MIEYNELLVSQLPVVVRRRVAWGECDPAGVVFTPRFAEYVVDARDWFMRVALGVLDRPHPSRITITYPAKAIAFEFTSFLTADDWFEMKVEVLAISRRTFTLRFVAHHSERTDIAFTATMTSVCFDQAKKASVELPPTVRAALENYRAQGRPDENATAG